VAVTATDQVSQMVVGANGREPRRGHGCNRSHVLPQPGRRCRAAPEPLAYVAAFDPAGQQKDAIAVVDCDPSSSTHGGVVGWAELPTAGNELHHFD
jgi:hypothetical protein